MQVAQFKIFRTESGVELTLFAFATKRIGANWDHHMELLTLMYNGYPAAMNSTLSSGKSALEIAIDEKMPEQVVMFFRKPAEQCVSAASPNGCSGALALVCSLIFLILLILRVTGALTNLRG